MQVGEDLQLLVEHIADEAQAVGGEVVLYLAVDAVFVNALAQQFADDDEDVGVVAVEGEEARIGRHASIEVFGSGKGQFVGLAQGVEEAEEQFAGAAQFGV